MWGETIPARVVAVLRDLEALDAIDKHDGTPTERRVRAVTPTAGRLLHHLALLRHPRRILELGTSAGYSTIWLASAARLFEGKVVSVDADPQKIAWARENLQKAGLDALVDLVQEDAVRFVSQSADTYDLVFMDHGSSMYLETFRVLTGRVPPFGVVIADGWGSVERWYEEPSLRAYREYVEGLDSFTTLLLPFEKGELISIRLGRPEA